MAAASQVNNPAQPGHCPTCGQDNDMKFTIECAECKKWIHYTCSALPLYLLLCLARTNRKYTCEPCSFEKYADPEWTVEASEAIERMKKEATPQTPHSPTPLNNSDQQSTPTPVTVPETPRETQGTIEYSTSMHNTTTTTTNTAALQVPATPSARLGDTPEDADFSQLHTPQQTPTRETQTPPLQPTQHPRNKQRHPTNQHQVKHPQTCKYYKQNKCKYGISGDNCSHSHPRPCPKLLQHGLDRKLGCTLGKRCPNFHPIICRDSLWHRKCYNRHCTYLHLKGTKRHRDYQEYPEQRHNTHTTYPRHTDRPKTPTIKPRDHQTTDGWEVQPSMQGSQPPFLETLMEKFLAMEKRSQMTINYLAERMERLESSHKGCSRHCH